jgi:hypothetical protein
MKGLTEGRMVHYVLSNGEHRPAVIVKVWDQETGMVNLQVILDGTNDRAVIDTSKPMAWETSRLFSAEPKPLTWHWIEQA